MSCTHLVRPQRNNGETSGRSFDSEGTHLCRPHTVFGDFFLGGISIQITKSSICCRHQPGMLYECTICSYLHT